MATTADLNTDAADCVEAAKINPLYHTVTSNVEQSATQLDVAYGPGLDHPLLKRLPGELRNKVMEMVLTRDTSRESNYISHAFSDPGIDLTLKTSPQVRWALSIMATCQQIRAETKDMLLSLNHINIRPYADSNAVRNSSVQFWKEVARNLSMLEGIPPTLGSKFGRVILRRNEHISGQALEGVWKGWKKPGLKRLLSNYAKSIHPLQLYLGLDMEYHGWGHADKLVCNRDMPITVVDCVCTVIIFPVGDRASALEHIEEALENKMQLYQRHSLHPLCPVRAMMRKFESGLERSRRYMQELVDLLFDNPEDAVECDGLDTGVTD